MQVSTVIPVYNNTKYLAEAVASVLMQRGVEIDVWIVDDGSTDDTPQLAERLAADSRETRVTVLRQAHSGAAAARNLGAARSSGEMLAFLDSDDLWTEGRLALMLRAFEANPALDVVFGHVQQFLSPELSDEQRARLICPPDPMPGYHPGGMLIRRAAFERIGGFDPRWAHGEIVDWYIRLREHHLNEALLPQVVFQRRIHGGNNILAPLAHQDYPRILKAALDRRRAQAGTEKP